MMLVVLDTNVVVSALEGGREAFERLYRRVPEDARHA